LTSCPSVTIEDFHLTSLDKNGFSAYLSDDRNQKALIFQNQWFSIILMNTDSDYFLLLIDIRESTRLRGHNAKRVMGKLAQQIRKFNRTLKSRPLADLRISYGDEIAGLFSTPLFLYDIVDALRDVLYPDVRLRFVVAKGRISVPSRDIRKVNGEVFKTADKKIRQLKKEGRFSHWTLGNPLLETALTSLSEMSNAILEDMTTYQREVFSLLKRGLAQKTIARKLGKHPQSVSDAVRRGKSELVLQAQAAIRMVLSHLSQ
jgi:DNA-binding CsgD family transcriptional regulator